MKVTTPEISWHNRDPVLSVDIQNAQIWHLTTTECGGAIVNFAVDLDRHQKAVNIVRFSPSKEILASGDDESIIILWKIKEREERDSSLLPNDIENKEQWISWKVLRGHIEDIYDISWSPDSNCLISGSVDNTAILWDIQKGHKTILSDHKGFVQGVSWDPCNQYVCTISTDRYCRLINIATKKVVQRVYKSTIPTPVGNPLEGKIVRLFYDDTFKSFFRRLTFSVDGSLIFVPSGIIESHETAETISNATIVFSRANLKEPIMILPTMNECTIAVRCCPVYFELREDGPNALITLPYRMIFAVATQSSVLIYDTQQTCPIGVISLIHYGRLNDLSWSNDGQILIVSSSDGYCSIIHFQESELAHEPKEINKQKLNEVVDDQNIRAEVNTLQTDKKSSEDIIIEETEDIKLVYNEESNSNMSKTKIRNTPSKPDIAPVRCHKTPRRVKLITLSSPKELKKQ
ncbi:Chromatin assembly factor 1 subunit B [Camponotus floridanus]|uniref:Chromatin assembly factor 1 subunit B n=1 Tax=Camponotus floridanus TaxID=104421 RepID=E2A634_CAMFO|nr:Chromatin assembly factor 1 subunit B [Camponotus floridanus]